MEEDEYRVHINGSRHGIEFVTIYYVANDGQVELVDSLDVAPFDTRMETLNRVVRAITRHQNHNVRGGLR